MPKMLRNLGDKVGSGIAVVLGFIHFIFFQLGLVCLVVAGLIELSPKSQEKMIPGNWLLELLFGEAIMRKAMPIVLVVVGSIIIILSFIGLIGSIYGNRMMLKINHFVVILLILLQSAAFISIALYSTTTIDSHVHEMIEKKVNNLNDTADSFKRDCDILTKLSEKFECCGAEKGPKDFSRLKSKKVCCAENGNYTAGCIYKIHENIAKNFKSYCIKFGITSGVIIIGEVIFLVLITCLIKKIKKAKEEEFPINSYRYSIRPSISDGRHMSLRPPYKD